MILKTVIIICAVFLTINVTAQNAFYDAQFFSKTDKQTFQIILDANTQNKISLTSDEIIQVENAKNFVDYPFRTMTIEFDIALVRSAINKYNKVIESNLVNGYTTGGGVFNLIPGLLSGDLSMGADLQTKVLDGLVKYIAEEFKKAQLITYMQTFEATIGKVGELEIIFPSTYKKLKTMDPTKFPELGDEFKEVFNKDLKSILDNLIHHIDTHKNSDSIEVRLKLLNMKNVDSIKNNKYYESLKLSADLSSKLINNYHPVDLFNYMDFKYYKASMLTGNNTTRKLHHKIGIIIHGINVFQSNLIDHKKTPKEAVKSPWINFEQLKQLNTDKEWEYFAGLIYQSDKAFFNEMFSTPVANVISSLQLKKIKTTFKALLTTLVEIRDFRANLVKENIEDNYIEYMKILTKAISQVNINNATLDDYLELADNVLSIYDNARKKDYGNSLHYTFLILEKLFNGNPKNEKVIADLNKYASFASDVINSEDSDAVKEIIKKHIAPPASFINKREYSSTISITAQPGYFLSYESLDSNNGFVSGITLPIGFELTWKLKGKKYDKKKPKNTASVGVFAQLLDLGAMLNFRVSDDTSTLPDKVVIGQVFSPGGSITYGFKNSPLTLGLGYQYTSELRKITLTEGNETYPNGHRIFFRLGWDIPLVNISKSKSK